MTASRALPYQDALTSSISYQICSTTTTPSFSGQGGVGYLWLRKEYLVKDAVGGVIERLDYDPVTGIPYDSEHNVAFNGAVTFEHNFNASTKILARRELALQQRQHAHRRQRRTAGRRCPSALALAAGDQITNNSKPPANSGKNDSLMTFSLVYDMKNPKSRRSESRRCAGPSRGAAPGPCRASSRGPSRPRACRAASCPWPGRGQAWRGRPSSTVPAARACSRALDRPDQPLQLGVVQQQLAGAVRLGQHMGGGRAQRRQVGAEQEGLPVAQVHVGLGELRAPGAHGLHLPALQGDARLVALLDEVLVARLAVLGDEAGGAAALVMGRADGTMGACERLSVQPW